VLHKVIPLVDKAIDIKLGQAIADLKQKSIDYEELFKNLKAQPKEPYTPTPYLPPVLPVNNPPWNLPTYPCIHNSPPLIC
jgi:hypothetical protein